MRKLDVYLRNEKTGVLEQDANANLSFTYDEEYQRLPRAQAISVSMPLSAEPYANAIVKPYFSGLLPDESARRQLARALGVSDTNAFGMLEIIGGECAGALSLFPQGHDIQPLESTDEILNDQQVAELIAELRGNPLLGGRSDIRLSLAGAQDKLAVKLIDGKIALVNNGGPTTHVLKPGIQGLEGTVQNEAFCMTLASRVGFIAPEVMCRKAGDTDFLLVERFDRKRSKAGVVERLHQEDFCQALSVPPEFKYEDEGGPGIAQSLALIQRVTGSPAADRLEFIRMQIFHFLSANADAHAKNFALLYPIEASSPSLAPVYDAVCTACYPELTKHMAMKIGSRNLPDTIRLKHWLSILPDTRASQKLLKKELTLMAQRTVFEAEQLYSEANESGLMHPVLNDILKIIKRRAAQIDRYTS